MLLNLLLLIWAIFAFLPLGLTLSGLWFLKPFSKIKRPSRGASFEPITVIKPLRGLDQELEANLETFFRLDYPAPYEILFCVADADDPAIPIARALIEKYPLVPARLLTKAIDAGPNPKICNMLQGYDAAKYPVILISDSNMRAYPLYLQKMAETFAPDVAAQSSIVAGVDGKGLGGRIEATIMNTLVARVMLAGRAMRREFVMGKSMMFRKSAMEKIGGMRGLAPYLAEDHLVCQEFHRLGLKVINCPVPAMQYIGNHSVRAFWSRHTRWGRMRKTIALPGFIIEPLIMPSGVGALGAWLFHARFGISPWLFLLAHFSVWFALDCLLMRKMEQRLDFKSALAWIAKEVLHLMLWVEIAASNTVIWRGNKIRLQWGGRIAGPRDGLFDRISERALRMSAMAVLGALGLVMVGQAYSLKNLNTHYSLRQFMPEKHSLYIDGEAIKKRFHLDEEEPVLVTLSLQPQVSGTWLTPERMAQIEKTTDFIGRVEGIHRVVSIANVESAVSTPKGIQVGKLLSLLPQQGWTERLKKDPLLSPTLVSEDQRTVMIVGDISYSSAANIDRIVNTIRAELSREFPSDEVRPLVGGVVPLQFDIMGLIGKELGHFLLLAFIACALTLLAYFRTISSALACLALVVLSNLGALSLMAMTGTPFSILSTTLPVLASITALSIGAHTMLNFGNRWAVYAKDEISRTKPQVIEEVYGSLFLPNFLMAVTTTIGFATLGWSQVPLIRQFAWSVSFGILMSWFLVSVALPPIMLLFPVPRARTWTSLSAFWVFPMIRARRWIFGIVALAIALVLGHGIRLNWSVRHFDDLPNAGTARETTLFIDKNMGGMIPLEMMIELPGPDPWHDPGHMRKLEDLIASWRKLKGVATAVGLPEYLNESSSVSSLKTREAIAEMLLLYSFSESDPVAHYLSNDGSATRVSVRLTDIPADEMSEISKRIETDALKAFPDAKITMSGMAVLAHPLNAELSKQLITGLWQSLFWISLLLVLVFRSLRWSIVAAWPNLLAPFALIATMAILHTPIKPAVALIFSIALGIAYNNTVYLLARMKILLDRGDRDVHAVWRAWFQEGNPCFFSTLSLVGGFAIFLTSYFAVNRVFGAYMLWSIGVGLFGDLVFLPVVLSLFPGVLFWKRDSGS